MRSPSMKNIVIQQLTEKSTAVLEQVESDMEQKTEKLIFLEEEL